MYTLILDLATVIRNSDGVIVSPCQAVDDPLFVDYQTWVQLGNQPTMINTEQLLTEEYSYANVVLNYVEATAPYTVTATQIRMALNRMGVRADVENLIAASNDSDLIDLWEYSTTIRKDSEHVQQVALSLGINIEEAFLLASTL
jgi:hypothetical protein